jgi:tubulin-specific chaperone C
MDRLGDRPNIGGERADAADHCLAGISRLSAEVKDASTYLPAYDQRMYSEAIKGLQDKLNETRAAFAPKQKFSFKSARKSPSAISLSDAAELAAQKRRIVPGYLSPNANTPGTSMTNTPAYLQTPPNEKPIDANRPVPDAPSPSNMHRTTIQDPEPTDDGPPSRPILTTTSTSINITAQTRTHILLPATSIHASTPCQISRLTSSVLDLSVPSTATGTPFASLTINIATNSLLILGSVAGPAHITGLRNCVLVLTSRQVRVHECENVDLYLQCASRPIIEDCHAVRFAPLPDAYATMHARNDITSAAELDEGGRSASISAGDQHSVPAPGLNLWDQVDDFKWLKTEPSPNWSVLPEDQRVKEEVWRAVVQGKGRARLSVDEILAKVGLPSQS